MNETKVKFIENSNAMTLRQFSKYIAKPKK